MHWIVQSNIFHERRYADVVGTLERGGIPHTLVRVPAFATELEAVPEVQNPVAVIGSYTLVRIAQSLGWGPGVFASEQLDQPALLRHWGPAMLNADVWIGRLADVRLGEPRFIRPVEDSKSFTGAVFEPVEFADWQRRITAETEYATVTGDTEVVVAPVQEIHAEYRLFVVDGCVVTGSRYKLAGRLSESSEVPDAVRDWATDLIGRWSPERAFVVDVAVTPRGLRAIECNCINSAGWYHANVSRVIQAIDALDG